MDAIRKDQEDRFLKRGKYRQGKGKRDKIDDCDIVDFEEELDKEISAAENVFDRKIAEAEASGMDHIKQIEHKKGKRKRGKKGKHKNIFTHFV